MQTDGSSFRWLDTGGAIPVEGAPRFLPDNQGIIFTATQDPRAYEVGSTFELDNIDIFTVKLDGTDLRNVTNTPNKVFEAGVYVK